MKKYHSLFRAVFVEHFNERMIPYGVDLNMYLEKYHETIRLCTLINNYIKQGISFDDPNIVEMLKNQNIESISPSFPSSFAFQRLSAAYLLSMCNTIIATCSTIKSLSSFSSKDCSNMESISEAVTKAFMLYKETISIDLPESLTIIQFQQFHIEKKDLSKFIDVEHEENELKIIEKDLENVKFKSHVCYLCNEKPAISVVEPCYHTFLCLDCLKQAVSTNNIWKCFVCGKKIDQIVQIRPVKSISGT